eukprot:jgi/Bigna1/67776/fgenesh1_pg.4_\
MGMSSLFDDRRDSVLGQFAKVENLIENASEQIHLASRKTDDLAEKEEEKVGITASSHFFGMDGLRFRQILGGKDSEKSKGNRKQGLSASIEKEASSGVLSSDKIKGESTATSSIIKNKEESTAKSGIIITSSRTPRGGEDHAKIRISNINPRFTMVDTPRRAYKNKERNIPVEYAESAGEEVRFSERLVVDAKLGGQEQQSGKDLSSVDSSTLFTVQEYKENPKALAEVTNYFDDNKESVLTEASTIEASTSTGESNSNNDSTVAPKPKLRSSSFPEKAKQNRFKTVGGERYSSGTQGGAKIERIASGKSLTSVSTTENDIPGSFDPRDYPPIKQFQILPDIEQHPAVTTAAGQFRLKASLVVSDPSASTSSLDAESAQTVNGKSRSQNSIKYSQSTNTKKNVTYRPKQSGGHNDAKEDSRGRGEMNQHRMKQKVPLEEQNLELENLLRIM